MTLPTPGAPQPAKQAQNPGVPQHPLPNQGAGQPYHPPPAYPYASSQYHHFYPYYHMPSMRWPPSTTTQLEKPQAGHSSPICNWPLSINLSSAALGVTNDPQLLQQQKQQSNPALATNTSNTTNPANDMIKHNAVGVTSVESVNASKPKPPESRAVEPAASVIKTAEKSVVNANQSKASAVSTRTWEETQIELLKATSCHGRTQESCTAKNTSPTVPNISTAPAKEAARKKRDLPTADKCGSLRNGVGGQSVAKSVDERSSKRVRGSQTNVIAQEKATDPSQDVASTTDTANDSGADASSKSPASSDSCSSTATAKSKANESTISEFPSQPSPVQPETFPDAEVGAKIVYNSRDLGFVLLPVKATFADARRAVQADLVPDSIPETLEWRFIVNKWKTSISLPQESKLGVLSFLQRVGGAQEPIESHTPIVLEICEKRAFTERVSI